MSIKVVVAVTDSDWFTPFSIWGSDSN